MLLFAFAERAAGSPRYAVGVVFYLATAVFPPLSHVTCGRCFTGASWIVALGYYYVVT